MENNDVGNTVPLVAEHHEGLQVAVTAAAVGVDNRLENGGGGGGGGHVEHEGAMVVAVANGGAEGGFSEKRKRGRPRKQLGEIRQELRLVAAENSSGPQKRGRGRPRGSGKWQTLANSFGLSAGETGGTNFTPYTIDIQAGENIVQKILSFSQRTADSMCILSASGTVSSAEIYLPASRGSILRYEGEFTIVCLTGSHTYQEKSRDKIRLLSVHLASSDGRSCGGAVGNSLIAAGPTQVIVSTFKQKFRHQVRASSNIGGTENGALVVPMPAAAAAAVENGGRAPETQRVILDVFNQSAAQPADWDSLQPTSNV